MARERRGHTLQPTAVVNEAFVRLVEVEGVQWQDRAHFFALASQMMRRILINYALARMVISPERDSQILALDDALEALARVDARKAKVVELRFFAGLDVDETAAVLKVSSQTVLRDWKLSKTWLAREMAHQPRT